MEAIKFFNIALFSCFMAVYRSGHNEAVLKTVSCNRLVGSNPTAAAKYKSKKYLNNGHTM